MDVVIVDSLGDIQMVTSKLTNFTNIIYHTKYIDMYQQNMGYGFNDKCKLSFFFFFFTVHVKLVSQL